MTQDKKTRRLARLAAALHARLARAPASADWELPGSWWQCCQEELERLRRVQQRGWHATAASAQQDLQSSLFCLIRDLGALQTRIEQSQPDHIASPQDIYADLLALEQEFPGTLRWSGRQGKLSVETEPIELEGLYLGPFRIELELHRLHEPEPYGVVALDPQPAAKDEGITHPHVQDEHLCAGEGTTAIRAALAGGRLLDFFVLVANILSTYNAGSPYVSLGNWDGASCAECDSTIYEAGGACTQCQCHLCEECGASCAQCGDAYCGHCALKCAECEEPLCRTCAVKCRRCAALYCRGCYEDRDQDPDPERCPACHARRNNNNSNSRQVPPPPQPAGAAL